MALNPGLQLAYGIQPVNPVPVDAWSGPYSGVDAASAISAANTSISSSIRFQSMEVRLIIGGVSKKYWYRDGTANSDLIEFVASGSGATPGGSDTYIQFNSSGTFGGHSGLTYATGSSTLTGTTIKATAFSGSLTALTDGSPFLKAGSNVTITTGANGSVTISSTAGGGGGGGDAAATYLVLSATASLANARTFATGTGISVVDAGAGGTYTLSVDNSVVATLTGSTFTGPAIFNQGLTGSLTKLKDGTAYLLPGANITLTTGSNGAVTISATTGSAGADSGASYLVLNATSSLSNERALTTGTGLTSSDAGAGGSYTLSIDNTIVATLTGSTFTGPVTFVQGLTGSLHGTASYASDADKLDGFDSTHFATTAGNTFTGVQIFNNDVTGTNAYFSGNVVINGTASIGMLNTLNQQSLVVGDKYITILSGATDHTTLDGSGILWGSGSTGPTVDDLGANAHLRYRSAYDALEAFPNLRVSGSLFVVSDAEFTGSVLAVKSVSTPQLTGSLTRLYDGSAYLLPGANVTLTTGSNGAVTISSTATGGGDPAASYLVLSATGSLSNERALTAGTGLSASDAGAGGAYTISIDDSVVATLTGSTFTGPVIFNQGLTGSLTKLTDGSAYLLAGNNVVLTTGSNGAVTISSTATGGGDPAASYLVLNTTGSLSNERALSIGTGLSSSDAGSGGNYTLSIDNAVVATLTGSTFTGPALFNQGLTGSLTKLTDGSAYLLAGANIALSTGSSGAITISASTGSATPPAGSDTQIQFNSGGAFGASSALTYNTASNALSVQNLAIAADLNQSWALRDNSPEALSIGEGLNNHWVFDTTDSAERLLFKNNIRAAFGSGSGLTIWHDGTNSYISNTTGRLIISGVNGNGVEVTGSLLGTASYASNADRLDGFDSSYFATTGSNNFSGIQFFSSSITGTNALFTGNVTINGTASIGQLNTITQQSLVVGDKYIVILSGAADHTTLDGSGILFGSGSTGPTVNELGANAHLRYRSTYDAVEAFPNFRVSGSLFVSGSTELTGSVVALTSVRSPQLTGSLTKLYDGSNYLLAGANVSLSTGSNGAVTITASTGSVGADPAASYLVLSATSSLTNERTFATGTGLTAVDGGANGSYTLSIDDSVVATLTGSTFTGPALFNQGLTGSLTKLTDGSNYLLAGDNITLTTGSNGAVTITSTATGGGGGGDAAATYLVLSVTGSLSNERVITTGTGLTSSDAGAGGAYTLSIDNAVVATLTGSTFTGPVLFNQGLTGSLTKLTDGSNYLLPGANVTLSTGSNGAVTISASTGSTGADPAASYLVLSATGSLSNERALNIGTGLTASDGGAGGAYTLSIDNSVVATLTGSTFTGPVSFNQGLTGSLFGTASYASNADKLDGFDSTYFATTAGNTFTGVQVFSTDITGTNAYFSGNVTINGTASIGQINTLNQQSLVIGDKYITILSGAVDHTTLDGSGLLWGSGSTGPTVDDLGANAHLRYRSTYDALEAFPNFRVSGSLLVVGNTELTGSVVALTSVSSPQLTGSLTKLYDGSNYLLAGANVTLTTGSNGAVTIAASTGSTGADPAASYLVLSATSSLSNERVLVAGTGLSSSDAGANGNFTLSINNAVVATLTGSTFTGPALFNQGLTGSLTKLTDGSNYLLAGANVTLVTGANGSVTISSTGGSGSPGGSDTFIQFNDGGAFGGVSGFSYDKTAQVVALTGSLTASVAVRAAQLTGSLTKLAGGSDYLVAGANITLATGSNGAVTITATTGSGSGLTQQQVLGIMALGGF